MTRDTRRMIRTLTLLNDGPGCNRQGTRPASRAWSIQPEEINEAALKEAMAEQTFAQAGCTRAGSGGL